MLGLVCIRVGSALTSMGARRMHSSRGVVTYFSSSLSLSRSKVSSHPTSMRTLTPPSSSSSD